MKYNKPIIPDTPIPPDVIRRFMAFVELNKVNGCWIWNGRKDAAGYGKFKYMGKMLSAHRVSYAMFGGKIEEDETVNHKCLHQSCVNPWHLETMTRSENTADANRRRANPTTDDRDDNTPPF